MNILIKQSKQATMHGKLIAILIIYISIYTQLSGQASVIGQGNYPNVKVTTSHDNGSTTGDNTMDSQGFLPNLNAASRFLSQSTFGGSYEEIEQLSTQGIETWIDQQFAMPIPYTLMSKVIEYQNIKNTENNTPGQDADVYFWNMAWWHYTMTSQDDLRQRIAFALSEFLVISQLSELEGSPYALASYYDILLEHSFGNYRDLLEDVTFDPAMGVYLTYMKNPKTDTLYNLDWSVWPPDTLSTQYIFPDENYAREVMQLFSIGLYELEIDGTQKLGANGQPIATYDNETIAEFSKVFTGLHWGDAPDFWEGPADYEDTFLLPMVMDNSFHEPGQKNLLNGFVVPDRNPVNGIADINDALDNLFNHPNVGPFLGKFMIQRLVTSNPSRGYIKRVARAFNGDGPMGTVRGDMQSMIKAILLDEEARSCAMADDVEYGHLREPFVRYIQLGKAFDLQTPTGEHRNTMYGAFNTIRQVPLTSPSVFNFFQSDYQPIGLIEDSDKIAPEFQITNTQTIAGYLNGLMNWIFENGYVEIWTIYEGEEIGEEDYPSLDLEEEMTLVGDGYLPQLIERLNMILAHGKLSEENEESILKAVQRFEIEERDCLQECTPYCDENDPNCDDTPLPDCVKYCEDDILQSKLNRVKLAIYLIMSSPEYLINR